ncbi:MAG: M28 family peptidase [Acidobacteriota bacterium]
MTFRFLLVALLCFGAFGAPSINAQQADGDAESAAASEAAADASDAPPEDAKPPALEDPTALAAEALAAATDLESFVDAMPATVRLADWHERFSSETHVAGTAGDRRLIDKMASYLESFDLDVEVHRFSPLLAFPVSARLDIVASPTELGEDLSIFGPAAAPPVSLEIKERVIEDNPYSKNPDLMIGWNAYAASGTVTAGVVYANYGTRQDFERLRELGISVKDKIVIARYGGNFRGFKEKFAADAGAIGLVIYTDPQDAGYGRGPAYHDGGWANSSYIQRGSLLTLDYPGDPLTPFTDAASGAERLDPETVALPRIPVQPIGWGAAFDILRRMEGEAVEAGWQGGLPLTYRYGGGKLRLRLEVEQKRQQVETANVVAFLPGATSPDEWVIIGSHHDAWSYGSGDPNSGTILVFEAARAFAAAAARGFRPARTLVFANWGAEEYGIIGSTEWVEGRHDELLEKAVAYINLDGAAMGTKFRASSSPTLKSLVEEVTREVAQVDAEVDGTTIHTAWTDGADEPRFGNLGGGSDHVGFYCHVGVPSVSVAAGGSPGVSYHSNYEDLHWYRSVVGDDYEGARMLARYVVKLVSRLAGDAVLPLDPARYGRDFQVHSAALRERASSRAPALLDGGGALLDELDGRAAAYVARAADLDAAVRGAADGGELSAADLRSVNSLYRQLERRWLFAEGLPERPWYRNLFAATDPDSGYGAWMLPGLRWAVENRSLEAMTIAIEAYAQVLSRLDADLDALEALLPSAEGDSADGEAADGESLEAEPADGEPAEAGPEATAEGTSSSPTDGAEVDDSES